jgi:hypothetical protein
MENVFERLPSLDVIGIALIVSGVALACVAIVFKVLQRSETHIEQQGEEQAHYENDNT